ncbi:MAG: phosphoribosylformimino-5-aminoimidazole carboxamide ribotide isomerase [Chitinispirillaceae bacterium]
MRFRPCIDLHNGRVKQIVGGTLSDQNHASLITNFETDRSPSDFALEYKKYSLAGGHVIMLGPGNHDAALEALSAFPGGLQVGGGIRPENAKNYLDAGASHVIVTSYVFSDGRIIWERLDELVRVVGKERLVLDLSCRKVGGRYLVVTDRWQKFTDEEICRELFARLDMYCDEYLVHAADVEGLKSGIDTELVSVLGRYCSLPVTYAGGIRDLSDLDKIEQVGKSRVDATVGSALDIFGGTLPFGEVVDWHRKRNP